MKTRMKSLELRCGICFLFLMFLPPRSQSENPQTRLKSYPLATWSNITCRAKGRFQDRDYCASAVMDQIVADGKSSIPILISQITDSRWVAEPVYDFWPKNTDRRIGVFHSLGLVCGRYVAETYNALVVPTR